VLSKERAGNISYTETTSSENGKNSARVSPKKMKKIKNF
jgi:hypothetical protein